MTTPNAYTRQTLVNIAGNTTSSLAELSRVLPHMRAVANSLTGQQAVSARQAVERAEELERLLTEADRHAESAKTLFRSATSTTWQRPSSRPVVAPCEPLQALGASPALARPV